MKSKLVVGVIAWTERLFVVAWAGCEIGPTADGVYYDALARRIAGGQGYTWLWPDGAVTFAAHYPVGYPAMLATVYTLFGAKPWIAMLLNAALGTLGVVAIHDVLERATSRRSAIVGALVVALHPALVPYTAAIMTEGVTASLLLIALALASRAREAARPFGWVAACGLVLGVATLVRPQSLLFAPAFGWLAASGRTAVRAKAAAVVAAFALITCAPWAARNCARMDRCALVSFNGGWNLAIGTQTEDGGWRSLVVPEACRTVFAEAAKDECFRREAMHAIASEPVSWLRRIPSKLRMTFDYFGGAPWYLHDANGYFFSARAKLTLGAIETIASRALLAVALGSAMAWSGPRRRMRIAVGAVGLVACFLVAGTVAYIALAVVIALLGREWLERESPLVPATLSVVVATALVHATFFGAGRYGLVVAPFVAACAFVSHGSPCAPSMPSRRSPAAESARARQREESPSSVECDAG